jgi:hypothetical protein
MNTSFLHIKHIKHVVNGNALRSNQESATKRSNSRIEREPCCHTISYKISSFLHMKHTKYVVNGNALRYNERCRLPECSRVASHNRLRTEFEIAKARSKKRRSGEQSQTRLEPSMNNERYHSIICDRCSITRLDAC